MDDRQWSVTITFLVAQPTAEVAERFVFDELSRPAELDPEADPMIGWRHIGTVEDDS